MHQISDDLDGVLKGHQDLDGVLKGRMDLEGTPVLCHILCIQQGSGG